MLLTTVFFVNFDFELLSACKTQRWLCWFILLFLLLPNAVEYSAAATFTFLLQSSS